MKILLVSWFFPTSNTIAAVRLGNLAKFLIDRGHDVKVVTAGNPPYSQTLDLGIQADRVIHTRWSDVNAIPKAMSRRLKRLRAPFTQDKSCGTETTSRVQADVRQRPGSSFKSLVGSLYWQVVNWPDKWVGWLPFAMVACLKLTRTWKPDLVFASGPPFTTLLIGRLISAIRHRPFVVEFRDRWWDDPYYPPPTWRLWLNRQAERMVVSGSIAISTVSEPWAETYRHRYGKPTTVVYNGYDPKPDNPESERLPSRRSPTDRVLRIVYTGGIYPGRRDPAPLFDALVLLGDERHNVRVEFYGTQPDLVAPLAAKIGVSDLIDVFPQTTHDEAVRVQHAADVLLLMQWNNPKEQGNVPGKFFEYIGAQRPILILGLRDGVPATIAHARGAGYQAETPEEIATRLRDWLKVKADLGFVPGLPKESRRGLSRAEQFTDLERFLIDLLADDRGNDR